MVANLPEAENFEARMLDEVTLHFGYSYILQRSAFNLDEGFDYSALCLTEEEVQATSSVSSKDVPVRSSTLRQTSKN